MSVNSTRPINLDLTTMKFPVMAISSILHRISGVVIFLSLPVWLWLLAQSLESAKGFNELQNCLQSLTGKAFLFVALSALAYHIVAGIKHLIMDMGIGETLAGGRILSTLTLLIAAVKIAAIGVWILW